MMNDISVVVCRPTYISGVVIRHFGPSYLFIIYSCINKHIFSQVTKEMRGINTKIKITLYANIMKNNIL